MSEQAPPWLEQAVAACVRALLADGILARALGSEAGRLCAENLALRAAARDLCRVTGEVDDDGAFVPCPQATLSMEARQRIAPWVEGPWRALGRLLGDKQQANRIRSRRDEGGFS